MKEISISAGNGQIVYAIVDDEDFQWLNDLTGWAIQTRGQIQLQKSNQKKYYPPLKARPKNFTVLMSRLIMLPWKEEVVLHRNGNYLDCRRENLEVIDISEARRRTSHKSFKVKNNKNYTKQFKLYQISVQRNGHRVRANAKTEEEAQRKVKEIKEQISGWEPMIMEVKEYRALDN